MYEFYRKNELIIAYHVSVDSDNYSLDRNEVADAKWVGVEKVEPWDAGTGMALRDWLKTRGQDKPLVDIGVANSGE